MNIRRGVIESVTEDKRCKKALVHGRAGESYEVDLLEPYGFISVPVEIEEDGKGSECILLDIGGKVHAFLPSDRRYRPVEHLAGDIVIYHYKHAPADEKYASIVLTDGGEEDNEAMLAMNVGKSLVTLMPDGNITLKNTTTDDEATIEIKNDSSVEIKNKGCTITIDSNGNVTVDSEAINVTASSVSITAPTISLGGS